MNLEGRIVRLRAVEPEDAELLYAWENDTSVWSVSGTTEPFSRAQMERFIAAQLQGGDLFRTGQLRLIVETRAEARPVGIADLFEFDPLNRRAGLIFAPTGASYAHSSCFRSKNHPRSLFHQVR